MSTVFVAALLLTGVAIQVVAPIIMVALAVAALYGTGAHLRRSVSDNLILPVALLIAYLLISGIASGGMVFSDLGSNDFLGTDGRIFFCYLPVLFFAASQIGPREIHKLNTFLLALALFNAALAVFWSAGMGRAALGGALFSGFMYHKTSAGGLFLILAIMLGVVGLLQRRYMYMTASGLMVIATLLAGSRQALVSVSLFVLWLAITSKSRGLVVKIAVAAAIAGMALPLVAPTTLERIERGLASMNSHTLGTQWSVGAWNPAQELGGQLITHQTGADWNVVGRIVFYRRAVEAFLKSPIVGVGFGRFNDPGSTCIPPALPGLFCLYDAPIRQNVNKNAHNSYLHFLAENGLVGFGLVAWFWLALYRRLSRAEKALAAANWREAALTAYAARGTVMTLPIGAFFGHAFGSPQLVIPILTIAMMVLAAERGVSPSRAASNNPGRRPPASAAPGKLRAARWAASSRS